MNRSCLFFYFLTWCSCCFYFTCISLILLRADDLKLCSQLKPQEKTWIKNSTQRFIPLQCWLEKINIFFVLLLMAWQPNYQANKKYWFSFLWVFQLNSSQSIFSSSPNIDSLILNTSSSLANDEFDY